MHTGWPSKRSLSVNFWRTRPLTGEPPQISADAVVQQRCHQHAVLDGYSHERRLLVDTGLDAEVLDSGCCGLAGNFGFENGHYEVAVACAEDKLLPALDQTKGL